MMSMNDSPAVETAILEARDVGVRYGAHAALRGVSLRVGEGEMLGLIGPNGSGKTTLLRALSGAIRPTAGFVAVGGADIRAQDRRALARTLAHVPQAIEIPVAYSVAELVAMGRTPYVAGWAPLSADDRAAVVRAMELMEVSELADRAMDELSAGERQRAIVAMALAQEPRILLLDEPTAHLDIQHAWGLMELVARMNRERRLTVIVSLHDLGLAAEFCPRLLLLERGERVASGAASEVLKQEVLTRVYKHPIEIVRRDARVLIVPGRV